VTVKNDAVRDSVEKYPDSWIGSVLAVRANAIMAPSDSNEFYSLFLPRMVEPNFRTDKTEPDSYLEVKKQFDNAVAAA